MPTTATGTGPSPGQPLTCWLLDTRPLWPGTNIASSVRPLPRNHTTTPAMNPLPLTDPLGARGSGPAEP